MLRAELAPLGLKATASYIAARLRVAGGAPTEVFTKDAVGAIYEASRGIPRIIGVICENALLAGYAAQKKPVDRAAVVDVCRDLDLPVTGRPPHAEGPPPGQQHPAAVRHTAAAEPARRPAVSRVWIASGSRPPRPDAVDEDAPAAAERPRMFKFF